MIDKIGMFLILIGLLIWLVTLVNTETSIQKNKLDLEYNKIAVQRQVETAKLVLECQKIDQANTNKEWSYSSCEKAVTKDFSVIKAL